MKKAISIDLWGTLIVSSPLYKAKQSELAKEFLPTPIDWYDEKNNMKLALDNEVELTGCQPNRVDNYRKLLGNCSIKKADDFIQYSNELFLQYPPLIKDRETDIVNVLRSKDIRVYISSNTVFVYGDVLAKIVYQNFGIIKANCNFSDEIGVSKPNGKMFDFEIKPTYHLGDNLVTDGAANTFGIEHYLIKGNQNFKTFLDYANI